METKLKDQIVAAAKQYITSKGLMLDPLLVFRFQPVPACAISVRRT